MFRIPYKLDTRQLLYAFLIIPLMKPVGLDSFPLVNKAFQLWKLMAILYLAWDFLRDWDIPKKPADSAGILGLTVFWAIFFVGCLRSKTDIVNMGTAGAAGILLFLFIRKECIQGRGMLLMGAFSAIAIGSIALHITSVFLVKKGLLLLGGSSHIYLFGTDNYSAFFLYPLLGLLLYYHRLKNQGSNIVGYLALVGVVFIYIYTSSMTAAGAGLLLMALLAIYYFWKPIARILRIPWVLGAIGVLLFLICAFQVQNLLASLLNSMSKGVTLNSRTYIWEHAWRLIVQRPIFGHGSLSVEQIQNYALYGVNHAHNLFMELLLCTGVVGTAGYCLFLCGFLRRRPLKALLQTPAVILLLSLVTQLVLSFMDFYPNIVLFYGFMAVLYSWEELPSPPRK